MEKRGSGPQSDLDEADGLRRDQPLLAELYGAAVSGRVITGPRGGMRIATGGDEVDPEDGALPSGPCCASVAGLSVHAGVCVSARGRLRLKRLARCAGRPPLSTEMLRQLPDGRLLYRLKRRWRDGITHVIYEPRELMERLAALVHPPRFNIARFSGIFAPGASLRPRMIPQEEDSSPQQHPGCQSAADAPKTDAVKTKKKRGCRRRNRQWATLMERGPRVHAPAAAFAFFPTLARLLAIKYTSTAIVPADRLLQLMSTPGSELPCVLVTIALGYGFILTAMLWGAFLAVLIDKRLKIAALYLGIMAAATFFGVIHPALPEGSVYLPWNLATALLRSIPYQFAAGYLVLALILLLLSIRPAQTAEIAHPAP